VLYRESYHRNKASANRRTRSVPSRLPPFGRSFPFVAIKEKSSMRINDAFGKDNDTRRVVSGEKLVESGYEIPVK
jgi:hypothetical protein